jgi:hypothetical protein
MDTNPSPFEDVLVIRALIDVLETPPAADVIDEQRSGVDLLVLYVGHQLV